MKGLSNKLTVMTGIASLVLSSGAFALNSSDTVVDPVTGFFVGTTHVITDPFRPGMMHGTEYLVSDKHSNDVKIMDGIKNGRHVSSEGNMIVDYHMYKGDKITNLSTHRSGTITGIKHHGTMDTMGANGKIVRYQYVTFKVKPL